MPKALIISCFDWYKTRLEPIRELLMCKGYTVTVLESDFDHLSKKQIQDRYPECIYLHVPEYKSNLSFQRIRSHLAFGKSVNQYIEKIKPDLIHIQVPPNNTAKYCTEYRKLHPETKLILDIVDLWPESMPLGKLRETIPAKKWKKWRTDCMDAADHIFTECDLYLEKLNIRKDQGSTLYLFKEQKPEERALVESIITGKETKHDPDVIRFAYLGSMNSIIDIEGICGVIKCFQAQGKKCELHAIGDGESREQFKAAAEQAGCEAHFYGFVFEEEEKIKILAGCDYAFNMMKGEISVGLTIKSIDYFSYGLPIINNIKGDTWKLVEDEQIGINVSGGNVTEPLIDRRSILSLFDRRFSRKSFIDQAAQFI